MLRSSTALLIVLCSSLLLASPDGAQRAASQSNQFGLSLFKRLRSVTAKGNRFFSPLSAYLAASMLAEGAEGATAAELHSALGLAGSDRSELAHQNREFLSALRGRNDVQLKLASSVWVRRGLNVSTDYSRKIETDYFGILKQVNFKEPSTAQVINRWVSESTGEKIAEVVLGPLPASAILYVINAAYFEAEWAKKFDKRKTFERSFYPEVKAETRSVKVPMMSQTYDFRTLERGDERVLELPYREGKTSLVVILPKEGQELQEYTARLDEQRWSTITRELDAAKPEDTSVTLPKVELRYQEVLNDSLRSLGVERTFDSRAEFASLLGVSGLPVSRVMQKTFLQVDEEGTKAAAVSSVAFAPTSAGSGKSFRVDRPYILAVRDHATNAILFIAAIKEPEGGK